VQKRAESRIVHLALHDSLTDLANRTQLHEHVEHALKRLKRESAAFNILTLDLDHFKDVNDTLGHTAGDELVKQVAARLIFCLRDDELVARIGGDEFAIVQFVRGEQREAASRLAERILKDISRPFDLNGHQAIVQTSIGIVLAPADGDTTQQLLKNADLALYRAKADGRNAYRFFDVAMSEEARVRFELEMDLRRSIDRGEFELHYQPLVNVATETVNGVEALVRWRHPSRGLVAPDQFIPLAESTGLIIPLGEWILRQACIDALAWPNDVKVAVNLSPIQFKSGNIVEAVVSALKSTGLAAERLELEVTESVLLQKSESNLRKLHELRELGASVALDDFGTGYSSLSYLRMFPFDKIKIDRSFISGMASRVDCAAIVSAITTLARNLDIMTTAEGVETVEQFELLRLAGCRQAQGFLFGRPVPASQLQFEGPGLAARADAVA
jgi:diguanylate cyclase (GGDEF)-like protein